MAHSTITLKFDSTCKDCGSHLPAGSRARYYGRGRVYGVDCHDRQGPKTPPPGGFSCPGAEASFYDPKGVYTPDGARIGTIGPRCEDAPCCGCC